MKILSKLLSRGLDLVLVLRVYPHMLAQAKRLDDSLTFHWKHLNSGVDTDPACYFYEMLSGWSQPQQTSDCA